MRFGIAFEGCAGRAGYHVGVAQWMLGHGLEPAAVAGASSGAIVAAALAAGRGEALEAAWLEVCGQPVFDARRLLRGRWPFAMSDIVGGALERHFGNLGMRDCAVPLAVPVTTVGLAGRRRRLITREDDVRLVDAVLASCFLPGPYSRMVRIDGALTFDGAWQIRTPIDALAGAGVERRIACVTDPGGRLAAGYPRARSLPVPADCELLAPVAPLPVGRFDLDRARMLRTIAIGRESAARFFSARPGKKETGVAPDAGAPPVG